MNHATMLSRELRALQHFAAASDPNTSPEVLSSFLVELELLHKQRTPPTWAPGVYAELLANPNLPFEDWAQLLYRAPEAALRNPSLALWLLDNPGCLGQLSRSSMGALVTTPSTSAEILVALIAESRAHCDSRWLQDLGVHPNLPDIWRLRMILGTVRDGDAPLRDELRIYNVSRSGPQWQRTLGALQSPYALVEVLKDDMCSDRLESFFHHACSPKTWFAWYQAIMRPGESVTLAATLTAWNEWGITLEKSQFLRTLIARGAGSSEELLLYTDDCAQAAKDINKYRHDVMDGHHMLPMSLLLRYYAWTTKPGLAAPHVIRQMLHAKCRLPQEEKVDLAAKYPMPKGFCLYMSEVERAEEPHIDKLLYGRWQDDTFLSSVRGSRHDQELKKKLAARPRWILYALSKNASVPKELLP